MRCDTDVACPPPCAVRAFAPTIALSRTQAPAPAERSMVVSRKNRLSGTTTTALVAKPKLPKSEAKAKLDVVDDKPGQARKADVPVATRGKSAIHARIGDVPIKNEKKPKNPKDNPEWFWKGKLKWKVAPPDVEVIKNPDNKDGRGWIEKWKSPSTGNWVHNYTIEELERKAGEKFARVSEFSQNIKALEKKLERDLVSADPKERQTALVVALIHHTYIRVGNEGSTKRKAKDPTKKNTYGITTMLVKHWKNGAFDFYGKSEVKHVKAVTDPLLFELVEKAAKDRSANAQLFPLVSADDVNAYLEPFGGHAKDFRTYHATRLAAEAFKAVERDAKRSGDELSAVDRELMIPSIVESVAEQIGHEPSVCRSNYIDPAVITMFVEGKFKK
jgi:DNA topoisomerase I